MLHEENHEFGIMVSHIDRIFQCRKPEFYQDTTLMENQAAIFALILDAMDLANVHLDATFNSENPELSEMWFAKGDSGDFISHFSYLSEEKSDAPPAKKSVFFVGKFELDKKDNIDRVAPFFYLHGDIKIPQDTNGQEVFFPLEAGCRSRLKGNREDVFCFTTNSYELVQMLCYGRKAFEMILTKQPISVGSLKHWLTEDNIDNAFQEYGKMIATDAEEFGRHITWEKATQAYKANPSYVGLSAIAPN